MKWAGIDIGKGQHTAALVGQDGCVVVKPFTFQETAEGYQALAKRLGAPDGLTVALEATGHYWLNLVLWLAELGYHVVVFNPAQTSRFAQAQMRRAKTDALDAVGIARCAMSLRPARNAVPELEYANLRELSRWRARQVQDLGDRIRQLHRQVDLVFPELPRVVKDLSTQRVLALLTRWPTARALAAARVDEVASLTYGRRAHRVGAALATRLVEAARTSIAQLGSRPHELIVPQLCDDIGRLQSRVEAIEAELVEAVEKHELGPVLTSAPGIGAVTAACVLAEVGNPATYASAEALCSDVGVVPGAWQSGKTSLTHRGCDPRGKSRLRRALWMPTLVAIQQSPWLKGFYERLRARGKRPKVALVAVMRKLLTALYAISKRQTRFVEPSLALLNETP